MHGCIYEFTSNATLKSDLDLTIRKDDKHFICYCKEIATLRGARLENRTKIT